MQYTVNVKTLYYLIDTVSRESDWILSIIGYGILVSIAKR